MIKWDSNKVMANASCTYKHTESDKAPNVSFIVASQ